MARPRSGYFTKDGTKVPSVTQLLSRFKESGALIHWSAKTTAEYISKNCPENATRAQIASVCAEAVQEYRKKKEKAADAGTLAHAAFEAFVKNEEFIWEGEAQTISRAKKALEAFHRWAEQTTFTIAESEVSLVSEKYRFGGTMDVMLINKRRTCGDYKTSGSVWAEYLVQVAAYGLLWEENYPDKPIDGGYCILRFDKEFGDFHTHFYQELESAKQAFILMRELYDYDEELKARAR